MAKELTEKQLEALAQKEASKAVQNMSKSLAAMQNQLFAGTKEGVARLKELQSEQEGEVRSFVDSRKRSKFKALAREYEKSLLESQQRQMKLTELEDKLRFEKNDKTRKNIQQQIVKETKLYDDFQKKQQKAFKEREDKISKTGEGFSQFSSSLESLTGFDLQKKFDNFTEKIEAFKGLGSGLGKMFGMGKKKPEEEKESKSGSGFAAFSEAADEIKKNVKIKPEDTPVIGSDIGTDDSVEDSQSVGVLASLTASVTAIKDFLFKSTPQAQESQQEGVSSLPKELDQNTTALQGVTASVTGLTASLASERERDAIDYEDEKARREENQEEQDETFGGFFGGLRMMLGPLALLGASIYAFNNDNFAGLSKTFQYLGTKVGSFADDLATKAATVGSKITSVVDNIATSTKNVVSTAVSKVSSAAEEVGSKFKSVFGEAYKKAGSVMKNMGSAVSNTVDAIKESPVGKAASKVGNAAKGVASKVGGFFSNIGSKVSGAASWLGKQAVKKLPFVGAIVESTIDWKKHDADYEIARTMYEAGELMSPETGQPLTEAEWADVEKGFTALKAGSVGRGIGGFLGGLLPAALGLIATIGTGGLAAPATALGATVSVASSIAGSEAGDALVTNAFGGGVDSGILNQLEPTADSGEQIADATQAASPDSSTNAQNTVVVSNNTTNQGDNVTQNVDFGNVGSSDMNALRQNTVPAT